MSELQDLKTVYANRVARRERVLARLEPTAVFPPDMLWLMADGIVNSLEAGAAVTTQDDARQYELCAAAEMALKALTAWADANDDDLRLALEKHRRRV